MSEDITFLKRNTLFLFSLGIITKFLGFLSQYLLISWLDIKEYGEFVYLLVIVGLISLFMQFGMKTFILKEFSPAFAKKEQGKFTTILRKIITLEMVISIITLSIFWIYITIAKENNFSKYPILLSLLIFVHPFVILLQTFVQAMKKVVLSKIISDGAVYFLTAISIAFLIWVISYDGNVKSAITLRIAIMALLLVYLACFLLSELNKSKNTSLTTVMHNNQEINFHHILKISSPMVMVGMMAVLVKKTDILMLGTLSSYENVGIYNFVFMLSQLSIFGLVSTNTVLAPIIAKHHKENNLEGMKEIAILGSGISTAFAVVFVLILFLFGDDIIEIISSDMSPGFIPMLILASGFFVNAATGPVGYLLTLGKEQKLYFKIMLLSAITNILLNYILIPQYGITGAAISTTLSMLLWNLLSLFFVRKKLKINTFGLLPQNIIKSYSLLRKIKT